MKRAARVLYVVTLLAGLLICWDRPALAQTWKLKTGGDWNNKENWIGGVVPDNGADVVFPNGLSANATISIDKEYKVKTITFLNDDARYGYRLTADRVGNRNARLTVVQQTGLIDVSADNKALQTIDVPIKIDNGAMGVKVTNQSTARLAFTKPIGGDAGFLEFLNPGPVVLAAVNGYKGTTRIDGSNVAIFSDAALGNTTQVTISGEGILRGFGSASVSAQRTIAFEAGNQNLAGDDGTYTDFNPRSKVGTVFDVQAKVQGGERDSLTILGSVRLGNTGNSVELRNGLILGKPNAGEAGYVYLKDDLALGKDSNTITVNNGGIVAEDNVNSRRNIVLAGPTSIEVVGADKTFQDSGIVSGALPKLVKNGAGTLRLSGINTYNGDTEVRKGTLWIVRDDNLGRPRPLTLGDGTVLRVSGTAVETDRTIRLGSVGASIQVDEVSALNAKGVISGGQLTKLGKGDLTLAATNTFATANIREGPLLVTSDRNLGAAGGIVTLHKDGTLAALDDMTTNREILLAAGTRGQPTIFVADKKTLTLTMGVGGLNNLVKGGDGTLVLSKESSSVIEADVAVLKGKLQVDGKLKAKLFNGSRVAGVGRIVGPGVFTNSGKVQAGGDPGTLTVDDAV